MYVRDVIRATAKVGGFTTEEVLSTNKTRRLAAVRQLGLLVASRVTGATWPLIGRVWGGRDRTTAQAAALKADGRLAAGDAATKAQLAAILRELGLEALPSARPVTATYRYQPNTIRTRIQQTQARLRTLRAQLKAMEASQ